MHKLLPQQITSVTVTSFSSPSTSTLVLSSARNRRIFGIANKGTSVLEVIFNQDGSGDPILLRPASTLNGGDGGSLEFNGYNGFVWAKGTGYIYHFSEAI